MKKVMVVVLTLVLFAGSVFLPNGMQAVLMKS